MKLTKFRTPNLSDTFQTTTAAQDILIHSLHTIYIQIRYADRTHLVWYHFEPMGHSFTNGIHFCATCFQCYVYRLLAGPRHLESGLQTLRQPTSIPPIQPSPATNIGGTCLGTLDARIAGGLGRSSRPSLPEATGVGIEGESVGQRATIMNTNTFKVIFTSKMNILDLV